MIQGNKALVAVYGVIDADKTPALYAGVTELETGAVNVVVSLPYGVRRFPHIPAFVWVSTEDTFVEYEKGKKPLLSVVHWYEEI